MARFHIWFTLVTVLAAATIIEGIDILEDDMTAFNEYLQSMNIKINSATELIERLNAFHKSKDIIQSFKTKYPDVIFELNKFALMTSEELRSFLNASHPEDAINGVSPRDKRSALDGIVKSSAPISFDLRTFNKVSPVKDQKQCGACWAFATIAATESQYLLRCNKTLDLAEQQLTTCDKNFGCTGGYTNFALDYLQNEGAPLESCLPYEALDNQSQAICTQCMAPRYKIDGYQRHIDKDEATLALLLYNYGPLVFEMYVPMEFLFYKSGILDIPSAECNRQNNYGYHAMTLVGYTADPWIVKNSWGTQWGEAGFARIKKGVNFCSMRTYVYAPIVNNTATCGDVSVTTTTTTSPTTTTPSTAATTTPYTAVPTATTTTVAPGTTTTTAKITTTSTSPVTTTSTSEIEPTGCPNYPDSPVMNDQFRNFILNTINGYRSRVAKGVHPTITNNGTYFPSGKNINKLSWDCRIEAAGREASETCQIYYNPDFELYGYREVYFWNSSASESPERAMELLIWTMFRDDVEGLREEDGEIRLYHPRRGFMNDKFETFACWYGTKNCNAAFSFNDPNANITAFCGFSPRANFTTDADGVLHRSVTYTLGSPCSVDSDCTNPNGFTSCDATLGLCTKTPTTNQPPTTVPTTPPYNPCAAGWYFYSNACYRYINASINRSQAQAEQWCVNQGKNGHLVSIHSEAENNFVKSLITSDSDNVLIGYKNQAWSDFTPIDYSNFSSTTSSSTCAALSFPTYQWKFVDCNGPFKQYICKRNV